jgi:hypothetical protein
VGKIERKICENLGQLIRETPTEQKSAKRVLQGFSRLLLLKCKAQLVYVGPVHRLWSLFHSSLRLYRQDAVLGLVSKDHMLLLWLQKKTVTL